MKVEELVAKINNVYGDNTISRGFNSDAYNISTCPTGVYDIDKDTGGIPFGRFTLAAGPNNSFKSMLGYHWGSQIQKFDFGGEKRKFVLVDLEQNFTPEKAEACGLSLDEDSFVYLRPATGNEAFNAVSLLMEADDVGGIMLDSLYIVEDEDEISKPLEKNPKVGVRNGLINRFIRNVTAKMNTRGKSDKYCPGLYLVNYVYAKQGMSWGYWDQYIVGGGIGLNCASSLTLILDGSPIINKKWDETIGKYFPESEDKPEYLGDRTVIGLNVRYYVKKNKVLGRSGMTEGNFMWSNLHTRTDIENQILERGCRTGAFSRVTSQSYDINADDGKTRTLKKALSYIGENIESYIGV